MNQPRSSHVIHNPYEARGSRPAGEQHDDMRELIKTLSRVANALEPLAEHVPALVDIAQTWNAGKSLGKTAQVIGAASKWVAGVAFSFAVIWAAIHLKWTAILGGNQP